MKDKIYSVLERLPDDGQRVMCFGHKTYCCAQDMDNQPDWHEVTFSFDVSSYKLMKYFPLNIENSVLQEYEVKEHWEIGSEFEDGYVIGVTKWKPIWENRC